LGLISFDSSKRPLAYKQVFFPIAFGGIVFILTITIIPTVYLRIYAIVASIIVRFMVDKNPFFFEALARVNNNTFHFQQHFKVACDLLTPPTHACFLPFEQFIKQ
jgi:hypothetical protein